MICMNKVSKPLVLSLLLLQGCSAINAFQVFPLIGNAIRGTPDIPITESFIGDMEYSFAKVRIGRSTNAVLTLAYINNGIYQWVSSDGGSIYTQNGRIIRTEGMSQNSHFLNLLHLPGRAELPFSVQQLLHVTDPDALLTQNSIYTTSPNTSRVSTYEIQEAVITEGINWSFVNTFVFDFDTGRPIKTTQYIHPHLKPFEIEFFYKF